MDYVAVRLRVADFARAKDIFEAAAPLRRARGITGEQVFRAPADSQEMLLLFAVEDPEAAAEYFQSEVALAAAQRVGAQDRTLFLPAP